MSPGRLASTCEVRNRRVVVAALRGGRDKDFAVLIELIESVVGHDAPCPKRDKDRLSQPWVTYIGLHR
jgi:hypothetical protein